MATGNFMSNQSRRPAVIASATVGTLTQHYNNHRTGGYLNEVKLTTSNVKPGKFGRLFECQVDGQIYAQILYVSNVNIRNKGRHDDVVYVATMANTVYALDAKAPDTKNPLWKKNLGPAVQLPDSRVGGGGGYNDIAVEIGIVSTPVISLDHKGNGGDGAIYVVAMTKESNDSAGYKHRLHALDISSGDELFGGPVQITGSVPGSKTIIDQTKTPPQTQTQQVTRTFTSYLANQRPGLLLSRGKIYIAFASFGDHDESEDNPYHGWIFSYDAATLKQLKVYNVTPHYTIVRQFNNKGQVETVIGAKGGIWQAGQGPAADDSSHLYFLTGNGDFNPDRSVLSDSVVKLKPDLMFADWFTPANQAELNANDFDLGSSGVLLLPDTNLLVGGGKEGKFYLLNRNHMSQIVQDFYVTPPDDPHNPYPGDPNHTHHIHGGPVYWNGPNGPWVYIWPENDFLKAFKLVDGRFLTNPISQSTTTDPIGVHGGSPGMPGGMLSISANGNAAGTGIVWASHPYDKNANQEVVPGILRAYDASDLRRELWNSKQNPLDDIGNFAKFNPPTIANGMVYLASFGKGPVPLNQQLTQQDRDRIRTTYHFSVYGLI